MNGPAHEYGRWGDTDAPATIVPVPSTAASYLVARGRYILMGWSLQNNGAGAGGVNIIDGEDTGGTLAFLIPLAAQAVTMVWVGDRGIRLDIGLFLQITTAIIRGAVFVAPLGLEGQRPNRKG